MEGIKKDLSDEELPEQDGTVPDKQLYRWKDDGGALSPEPDPEPAQEED